jgi:hypothetical protein
VCVLNVGVPHSLEELVAMMNSDAETFLLLRAQARTTIDSGRLAPRAPDRTWVGAGGGGACAVCRQPIPASERQFEIEFDRMRGGRPGVDTFHVHVRCFAAWEAERRTGTLAV